MNSNNCDKCQKVYKDAKCLAVHRKYCGIDKSERQSPCENCGRRITERCMVKHLNRCNLKRAMQRQQTSPPTTVSHDRVVLQDIGNKIKDLVAAYQRLEN